MERTLELVVQHDMTGELPMTLDRDGNPAPSNETERRIAAIMAGLSSVEGSRITSALVSDEELASTIGAIHDAGYLAFLERASRELGEGEMILHDHPYVQSGVTPETPVIAGIYRTALASARTAIGAAHRVADGAATCYALCRPPGHHAGPAWLGGYCYLNNAALALATLLDCGMARVALIDFDFHFGNGSAAIVEDIPNAFFGSVHSSTLRSYPYTPTSPPNERQIYCAFDGAPSPSEFLDALALLIQGALDFGSEALVVSAGYDIIAGDPHGTWTLPPSILHDVGAIIGGPALPVCIVQEGGYRLDALEECAASFGKGIAESVVVQE